MKITHLGTETCVTGSCHLDQVLPDPGGGIAIPVDCGMAQGRHFLDLRPNFHENSVS